MDYVLGNITGLSSMAGYGVNPPATLYHKASYNSYITFPLIYTLAVCRARHMQDQSKPGMPATEA